MKTSLAVSAAFILLTGAAHPQTNRPPLSQAAYDHIRALTRENQRLSSIVADLSAKFNSLRSQLDTTPPTTNIVWYTEAATTKANKSGQSRAISRPATIIRTKHSRIEPNPTHTSLSAQLRSASNDLTQAQSELTTISNRLYQASNPK
jgi:hypothetical protein